MQFLQEVGGEVPKSDSRVRVRLSFPANRPCIIFTRLQYNVYHSALALFDRSARALPVTLSICSNLFNLRSFSAPNYLPA
jgi:hypothetical protein